MKGEGVMSEDVVVLSHDQVVRLIQQLQSLGLSPAHHPNVTNFLNRLLVARPHNTSLPVSRDELRKMVPEMNKLGDPGRRIVKNWQ